MLHLHRYKDIKELSRFTAVKSIGELPQILLLQKCRCGIVREKVRNLRRSDGPETVYLHLNKHAGV